MIHQPAAFARRRSGEIDELVCAILAAESRPLSAYDIAGRASQEGRRVVPAQVYRALARLVCRRRVLRIEMLGAYVLRPLSADLCLVCLECRRVQLVENPAVRAIQADATGRRFRLAAAPVEAGGLCGTCDNRWSVSEKRNIEAGEASNA